MPDANNTYTTIQGDTYDIVSFKLWGTEKLMHLLIEANSGYQDTIFFSAGTVLNVPDVEPPLEKGPVPPWQR